MTPAPCPNHSPPGTGTRAPFRSCPTGPGWSGTEVPRSSPLPPPKMAAGLGNKSLMLPWGSWAWGQGQGQVPDTAKGLGDEGRDESPAQPRGCLAWGQGQEQVPDVAKRLGGLGTRAGTSPQCGQGAGGLGDKGRDKSPMWPRGCLAWGQGQGQVPNVAKGPGGLGTKPLTLPGNRRAWGQGQGQVPDAAKGLLGLGTKPLTRSGDCKAWGQGQGRVPDAVKGLGGLGTRAGMSPEGGQGAGGSGTRAGMSPRCGQGAGILGTRAGTHPRGGQGTVGLGDKGRDESPMWPRGWDLGDKGRDTSPRRPRGRGAWGQSPRHIPDTTKGSWGSGTRAGMSPQGGQGTRELGDKGRDTSLRQPRDCGAGGQGQGRVPKAARGLESFRMRLRPHPQHNQGVAGLWAEPPKEICGVRGAPSPPPPPQKTPEGAQGLRGRPAPVQDREQQGQKK
ncbi:spidroin-1-like isoform X2 [Egretta garzetta]|uniref:spidroin-1-like isoform X2 n=1 Tax=Egretta garzetta TaxID=188379 RepID=UPI00163C1FA5|nr:spidroin-1-like isoform X2 [Egretta garzetta]